MSGMIWCERARNGKHNYFKGGTEKYYEIHAVSSDKLYRLASTRSRMSEFVQL